MALIDILNWVGKRRWLRPVGVPLLWTVNRLPLSTLTRIAGRRIIGASAGAPALVLTDTNIRDALNDPILLFEAMKSTIEQMGLDLFCLVADMSLEAEACGCQIQYSDKSLPSVVSHPVKTIDDVMNLRVPDPQRDGRMPVFIETMKHVRKTYTIKIRVM